jgi:N2-citryl-N6-acetyl-N6-hydroxylysine synthase
MNADSLSANCYLNSLLRELPEAVVRDGNTLVLALDGEKKLRLPLRRWSRLGRHKYRDPFFLEEGSSSRAIDFASLVDAVNARFEASSSPERLERFRRRVLESRENIRSSLQEGEARIRSLYASGLEFLSAEQGLFVGHNFHPSPKSREGLSEEDLRLYTPEFGASFPIAWYAAEASLLVDKSAATFAHPAWLEESCVAEGVVLPKEGFVPFPVHPWQEKVLLADKDFAGYLAEGRLARLGDSRADWAPTSSVRSLYRQGAEYMLKFSLSARLTNSVRHLLPQEVERGGQLFDVLNTRLGREFRAAHPAFHVIGEPAFCYLRRPDGSAMLESVVVCRENPFQDSGRNCAVLATLTQDNPLSGLNLIQQMIASGPDQAERSRAWFQAYLEVAVRPLFVAQAHYGIAMGAHQQNLILGFQNGLPDCAYFRDCQGTGYSELGFANFQEVASIQRSNGNILTEEMGNYLFSYYLILNSTFNVITAIASSGWVTEEELLGLLREMLLEIKAANPPDASCLNYLLEGKHLMHKGNFLCSVQNTNENTIENPLSIYVPVENPLAALGDL